MERVVTQGTAKWLGNKLPKGLTMAGKTGTTDDLRDSWFAGFSGDKVAVVWLGRDDYQPMGLAGGTGALRVWGAMMLAIPNEPLPDVPPDGVVLASRGGVPHVAGAEPASQAREGRATADGAGDAEEEVAQAAEAATQPSQRPRAAVETERPRQNPFMSDFYN
jgi:penicillin-binding protein 1B